MSKLDTIKLYKDSEYVRLFGDDDTPEEVMESVYNKELGSSFVKVESGVVIERPRKKQKDHHLGHLCHLLANINL